MTRANTTQWMWAQACDLIEQAERMHRQFFRLAGPGPSRAIWEPPVNVFEDDSEIVVVVALPGVASDRVHVTTESGELVVRAETGFAFSASPRAVRRLEIPYGLFERRIRLPEVRLEADTGDMIDGCLVLRLRKLGRPGAL